jgi:hypothetical protein
LEGKILNFLYEKSYSLFQYSPFAIRLIKKNQFFPALNARTTDPVDRISDILAQMTNGTIIVFWPTFFFHCPFRNWPTSRMFNPQRKSKK